MLCLNMEALKATEFASGVGRGRGNGCAVSEDHESRDWWVLDSCELVSATLLPSQAWLHQENVGASSCCSATTCRWPMAFLSFPLCVAWAGACSGSEPPLSSASLSPKVHLHTEDVHESMKGRWTVSGKGEGSIRG